MGFFQNFLPEKDRYAALLLYGMVFSTCFNGYDAGTFPDITLEHNIGSRQAHTTTQEL